MRDKRVQQGKKNSSRTTARRNVVDPTYHSTVCVHPLLPAKHKNYYLKTKAINAGGNYHHQSAVQRPSMFDLLISALSLGKHANRVAASHVLFHIISYSSAWRQVSNAYFPVDKHIWSIQDFSIGKSQNPGTLVNPKKQVNDGKWIFRYSFLPVYVFTSMLRWITKGHWTTG